MTGVMAFARPVAALLCAALLTTLSGAAAAADAPTPDSLLLTDFTPATPDLNWFIQNDNVMGGRSQGDFELAPGEMIFTGSTNTRGGGFSSVLTRRFDLDLTDYTGIEVRLRADGRVYTWELASNARNSGYPVSYWAEFATRDDLAADEYETVRIPFASFYPHFRGFRLREPALDPAGIRGFGLYIYDKQDGPFSMRLQSVAAYR